MSDLQDAKADLHCPECQGVLEAGQVEFDTESGLDIWWHGDATPPRKGWRRFFGALYETLQSRVRGGGDADRATVALRAG